MAVRESLTDGLPLIAVVDADHPTVASEQLTLRLWWEPPAHLRYCGVRVRPNVGSYTGLSRRINRSNHLGGP